MENRVAYKENGLAVLASANELRTEQILIDVVLVVNGRRLEPCHKFMLASHSPYFRAMFTHGMIEQQKTEIEIKGVEQQSLEAIIAYMYTGKVSITDDNAQGLLTTCSLLQMTGLYRKCREYMIQRLDITNCLSMYQFARIMCCVRLQNEALRFISKKFVAVSATDHWFVLSKDELIDIISSDDLWVRLGISPTGEIRLVHFSLVVVGLAGFSKQSQVVRIYSDVIIINKITKEEIVYEATLSWLVSDLHNRSVFVAEVLSHIRFALIAEDFIDKCILEEEAILDHPSLRIQAEAAKSHISNNKEQGGSTLDSSGTAAAKDDLEVGHPFFMLPVQGLEKPIKVHLNVKLRAGMDTKELLVFTNGRRTFAMNPDANSEYYGCLDTATQPGKDAGDAAVFGWSSEIPVMKNPDAHFSADGSVFLLGGLEIERALPLIVRTKLFCLEENSLNWTVCESMPSPRCMAAYGSGCGHLYVMDGEVVPHVMKYSMEDDKWRESVPMPLALYGHGSTSYEGNIFVTGGKTTDKSLAGDVFCLDCYTETWTSMESLSTPRFLHGMAIDTTRNKMLVVGGSSDNGLLDSVEEFDNSKQKWSFGESFPGNRCGQYVTEFGGEIHAIGGYVTERTDEGNYGSREMHDIFVLENRNNQWSRKTRRIRGTNSSPMACVKVRLHTSKLPRASIISGLTQL